jgi:hydrogenase/urease accessory protein HupE
VTAKQKRISGVTATLILSIYFILFSANSLADKLAPSLLQIEEVQADQYQVLWRTPIGAKISPEPILPKSCQSDTPSIAQENTKLERRWLTSCNGGLKGKTLAVNALGASGTIAMLRFQPLNGNLQQVMLTPEAPRYSVPKTNNDESVFIQYIRLGFEHILGGTDHLFFVTALLLLAGSWLGVVKTVSAFTLGHSVTLALVSLELISVWPPVVELSIAATILVLALELSRPKLSDNQPYIKRHPWLVASLFGLIHGLGFAGALQEIGIPASDVVSALLAFNVGIELGQLAFVGLVSIIFYVLRQKSEYIYNYAELATITVIGGVSVYWCLDRGAETLQNFL